MGEVYRARDTRLDRVVALKVIQPAAAANPEMRDRFEREARAISALDHPHICALYDVCREGDISFLVMQYLEGETLADRLARAGKPASDPRRPSSGADAALANISRGPIPFDTALKFAAEIAQALDAAHRRGIVHRDLKPGNVMLTKAGTKLLDFGLAKIATTGFAAAGDATRTSPFGAAPGGPLTGAGAILGTLYYMSPEQLEGREVDSRSDIHAFGAVLFEMLSGRRAFDGQSQAGILAAIISTDAPTLTALADAKTMLPVVSRRALDRLLAKCLAKDPDARWQSAADLAAELQWINEERLHAAPETAPVADPAVAARARRRERIVTSVAAAAIIALAAVSYSWYPRPAPPPAQFTFTIDAPPGLAMANGPGLMSVSADGTRVAFVTGIGRTERIDGRSDETQLWIRNLNSLTSQPLAPGERVWHPVWSPNGKSIAFTEAGPAGALRSIDVPTGTVRTIAPSATGRVAWSPTGVIVFKSGHKLFRVPEGGGTPEVAMELDASRQETDLDWPVFLPDGRRYLFLARSSIADKTGIFLAALDSSTERTFLVDALSNVEYAGGYLFYQGKGTLMAHAFDADAGRLAGAATPVIEDVRYNGPNGRAAFSVSASGVLVYAAGDNVALADRGRVMLFDRFGKSKQIGPPGRYSTAMLSPDGRQAVVSLQSSVASERTLSLLDIERGLLTPFTIGIVEERYPIWSHDGLSVIFASPRQGTWSLYRRSAAGGATQEERLFSAPEQLFPWSVSPDGSVLLFGRGGGGRQRVWALPLTGDNTVVEAIPGVPMAQYNATFSKDGKWIAFGAGTARGEGDIYIQPYPATDRRERISSSAGRYPYWTPDNRHLFYRTTDDDFMSVDLTPDGRTFHPSLPVKLFNSPHAAPGNWQYSMDAHREKFLMVVPSDRAEAPASTPLTVIVNWVQNVKTPR